LAVEVTPGQRHESTQVEAVMNAIGIPQPIGRPRKRPHRLAGDKGYSYPTIRRWLAHQTLCREGPLNLVLYFVPSNPTTDK
jgi:hypothetical protein